MSNIDILNLDSSKVVIGDAVYEHGTLNATGAITLAAGTVLARITASGKWTHYLSGGAGGAEIPRAILTKEVVFAGAGDVPEQVLINGKVRERKLIAFGVGAITVGERDELRDFGIISQDVVQHSEQDNQ